MNIKRVSFYLVLIVSTLGCIVACNNAKNPPGKDIANTPEELAQKTSDNIRNAVTFAVANNGSIGDSVILARVNQVQFIYEKNQFTPVWSNKQEWVLLADSLLRFIADAKLYGLFPADYHYSLLDSINTKFKKDSLAKSDRKDAALWSRADIALTDAFVNIVNHLKLGRLPQDSVSLRKDSVISDEFIFQRLQLVQKNNSLALVFHSLEPKNERYDLLKAGIRNFLDHASDSVFTIVTLSSKGIAEHRRTLQKRLYEGGFLATDTIAADSVTLAEGVKLFQKQNGITVDGKAGEGTVRMLNTSDKDKFVRIAISLDRYKLLPEKMPDRYIWVNLPGYYMQLQQADSIKLYSKIICGKPLTRTPLLTSSISELVTFPQWTIPTSIIVKEILPALKKNPGYLAKKGFSLIDSKGDEVDPYTIDWSKYSKGIPYRVVQGSGDDNALGILKFNFPNKYAVYLHDTNQRYLFGQVMRSLSHGCVRVQEWEKLAYSIVRYDNKDKANGSPSSVEDSLKAWLQRKEKHSIPVKNRLPVYLRYFTCDGKDGKIVFYDDIYGEDKFLRQKYFAGK